MGVNSIVAQVVKEVALTPQDQAHRFTPRKLGNIHLGVRVPVIRDGKPAMSNGEPVTRPKATEYFVLPLTLLNDVEFTEALSAINDDSQKPTRLPIRLMSENLEDTMEACREIYGSDGRLKCRSYDEKTCIKLNTTTFEYDQCDCATNCPFIKNGQCIWHYKIRIELPDARGFGYWKIVSTSKNSRANILTEATRVKHNLQTLGAPLSGMDLHLVLNNERKFHVRVLDKRNGDKPSLQSTCPSLLYLEPPVSKRKLEEAIKRYKRNATTVEIDFSEEHDFEDKIPVDDSANYTDAEIVPNDDADDGPSDVGEPEPEGLRDALLDSIAKELEVKFQPNMQKAFLKGADEIKSSITGDEENAFPILAKLSIDQLQIVADKLATVPCAKK